MNSLPDMVAGVWSDDSSLQLKSITQFRKFLSIGKSLPIDEVIGSGVVPRVIEFLNKDENRQLQYEAAWVLTNIASGTSDHVKVLIDHNAVSILVQLLVSRSPDIRKQVVWALGNIAADSPLCRDLVLRSGALMPILNQLNEHARLSLLRTVMWTLSNLCRGKPQPNFNQLKEALPVLKRLIHSSDKEVLIDACWALSYLSDTTSDKIQTVIESGVVARLIQLLLHPSPAVILPALLSVGNIVTGNDEQIQLVIDGGALPCLVKLLTQDYKKSIKKRACYMISNITAGSNRVHVQSVLEASLIAPLVNLFQNTDLDTKNKVALVISNAIAGGSHDQIKCMVEQGCIKPLCDLLVSPDISIVTICLGGLVNILKVGESEKSLGNTGGINHYVQLIEDAEGLGKIEKLQSHDNHEIYEKAVKILNTDWTIIEKEDETEQPSGGDGSQASFWKRALGFIR